MHHFLEPGRCDRARHGDRKHDRHGGIHTPGALLGDTKLAAEATDGREVFIGLGPAADVQAYLQQVEHDTVLEIRDGEPIMRSSPGGAPTSGPEVADFWVAQATGHGAQVITWSPANGDWAVLVMNAYATSGVDVDVSAGALVIASFLIVMPLRAVSRVRRNERRPSMSA